jgi:hypothetical protein
MNCRPLAPFQSSACSAFTATKPTLHRPAARPGSVPDAPFGTFLPEIATAYRSGVLCAAAPLIGAATDRPESAIGAPSTRTIRVN